MKPNQQQDGLEIAMKKMTTELLMVTPVLAQAWLQTMTKQRSPDETKIRAYADDMTRGEWELTGETIQSYGLKIGVPGLKRRRALRNAYPVAQGDPLPVEPVCPQTNSIRLTKAGPSGRGGDTYCGRELCSSDGWRARQRLQWKSGRATL